ncbi:MAG: CPBP family intramembrane metalloprotease [Planctomycetaceae bacterium]|nr:CPBP family intramembrane metalloprotease [Planctomycetaceae bacterium]
MRLAHANEKERDDVIDDDDAQDDGGIVQIAVIFEAGLAPLALVIGWLLGQRPLEGFEWAARDAAWGAVAALPMLGMFWLAWRWPAGSLAEIKKYCIEELIPVFRDCGWHDLALIALVAGIGEELLFRGTIQAALSRWLGLWPGLAVASLLFGFLHPITPTYVAIATLLGTYLGAVWIATGNLLTVVIAHAIYDFVALVILHLEPSERSRGSD